MFTLGKSYGTNLYLNVHKNNNNFLMFCFAKFREVSGACIFGLPEAELSMFLIHGNSL